MPPVVFHAIVLRSHEAGSTSLVIHTLSAEFGKLSLYGKGLQSTRSSLRGVLQPLSLVEVTVALKEGAEMGTLRDAVLIEDRHELTNDLERLALAMLLVEATADACEVAQPAPDLFATLLHGLHELDPRSGMPAPLAAMRGLYRVVHVAGYEPQIEEELLTGWPKGEAKPEVFWLDLEQGVVHARLRQPGGEVAWPMVPPPDATQFPIPPRAVRFLYEGQRGEPVVKLTHDESRQLLEALLRLAEWHHGGQLQSARFWREIDGRAAVG